MNKICCKSLCYLKHYNLQCCLLQFVAVFFVTVCKYKDRYVLHCLSCAFEHQIYQLASSLPKKNTKQHVLLIERRCISTTKTCGHGMQKGKTRHQNGVLDWQIRASVSFTMWRVCKKKNLLIANKCGGKENNIVQPW